MFTIHQRVTIARPVDEVFACLADPESIPGWRPDVLEARSGGVRLQLGSEFDEVINFGGRKSQTFRVTVFEPNETLEVAAIAGLGIRPTQRYALSTRDRSTTVSIRVTVRTRGLFRLLEPLLPKMIAAKWRTYGDRLRGLLENQPVVPSTEEIGAAAQLRQSAL
jgi:uncharacterized protein YndB with AHSA1/START domain